MKALKTQEKPAAIETAMAAGLVEARGVEPLSENPSTNLSPGADDHRDSPAAKLIVRLCRSVAS